MSYHNNTKLQSNGGAWPKEILAGLIGYLTTVYIVAVNGSILSEAGVSLETGMIATILASFSGTLLMGLYAKLPLILIPGMGINALFAFSIVGSTELTFQEGLAVVFVAALLFLITAFTKIGVILKEAIPESLKHAITVGLGFFLILIGLEKSGLVVSGEQTIIAIGDFTSPEFIASLLTLFVAIFLFMKNIPANFLVTMVAGTFIAYLFGLVDMSQRSIDMNSNDVLFIPSFTAAGDFEFWLAVFPLTLILIFENMGLLHGQLHMLRRQNSYNKAYQATAFSTLLSAFFGTSPTVSAAENAAVINSEGKTEKAALTAGLLFLATLFIIPWISMIPNSAISPILVIVGVLMAQNLRNIPLDDLSEALPAFLITAMIPFTYSIADGMAFGFIAYPIVKIAMKKHKGLSPVLIVISALFLLYFVMKIAGI
ncbi:putative MFS transporter, AGZA family, xanthine/uracil permease [Lentibacillus persicus]|uniref:Putative MFS transporter, AGZA family, xanthine/uracil permease n=1 Tax=Lentibacillus persicus TaxID=640948 RepID=A0A1I1VKG5_9BACI|nr:NCS2 family permease [Lentibacillus persicus]SFD81573.1 putative MFS transporter, AGZA family, xanthine/uracil permease [Lentibacillus persicus]